MILQIARSRCQIRESLWSYPSSELLHDRNLWSNLFSTVTDRSSLFSLRHRCAEKNSAIRGTGFAEARLNPHIQAGYSPQGTCSFDQELACKSYGRRDVHLRKEALIVDRGPGYSITISILVWLHILWW